jgi:putative Holliday junction resolvase
MPEMEKKNSTGRLLGIDPGEKRIGLSISDPTATISRPLCVINHASYQESARSIVKICQEHEVAGIIIGISYDENSEVSFSGRKAQRLGNAILGLLELPLEYWDETDTTKAAQQSRREMGVRRKRRQGHLDDIAACILLQSYIDAQCEKDE